MARSKKKIEKPVLTEEDKRRAEREAHRRVLKETGQLSVPVHKVHRSKKKYSRKKKKREEFGNDEGEMERKGDGERERGRDGMRMWD